MGGSELATPVSQSPFFPDPHLIPLQPSLHKKTIPLDDLLVYDSLVETMARKKSTDQRGEMLQGTLDMLVLKTLLLGPAHGHTIAHVIEKTSEDVLEVEHGSLYPALHRLEDQGLIASFWGSSENNRKARYYRMTHAGRKHLTHERSRWDALVQAIARVLGPAAEVDS